MGEVASVIENCPNILNQRILREWILFNLPSSINKHYKHYFLIITLKTLEEVQGLLNITFSKEVFSELS